VLLGVDLNQHLIRKEVCRCVVGEWY